MEVVYFELNNWCCGEDYPAEEPFETWFREDTKQQFLNEEWIKENKLCVVVQVIDMSFNYLVTAPKSWVDQNCPNLFKYKEFLRYAEDEIPVGRTGEKFLIYKEENIGLTKGNCY